MIKQSFLARLTLALTLVVGALTPAFSADPIKPSSNVEPNSLSNKTGMIRVLNRTTVDLESVAKITLDASASRAWRLVTRPSVSTSTIIDPQSSGASFLLDALGEFVFELASTDQRGARTSQQVRILSVTGPEYRLEDIEAEFASEGIVSMRDALIFGEKKSLNYFQVDYLMDAQPAESYYYALTDDDIGGPNGGATFSDRDVTFTMENMLQVPYKFSKVKYPDDYQKTSAKTVTVIDPVCKPSNKSTLIPADYMGDFDLPEIQVFDVGQSNIRMVRMKDVWDTRQGSYVVGCVNDIRVMFQQTLAKLKDLGVNTVAFTPWQWFDGREEKWRVMSAEESNAVAMSDRELRWAVAETKRQGLQAFWVAQAQSVFVLDENGEETMLFGITDDPELVIKTFEALEDWFRERGEFLEGIGVDGVLLPNWYWTSLSGVLDQASYIQRTVNYLTSLREHFSGTVVIDPDPSFFTSNEVANLIDYYTGSIYISGNVSADVISNWKINDFKQVLTQSLNHIRGANKPVLWDIGIPSRTNALEPGYVEETFCNAATSGIAGFSPTCIQKDMPTDFSFQAVFTQAALESLAEQIGTSDFPTSGGIIGQYWMNDNIIASTSFPNLAYSMRSKPAEYIFYRWFRPYQSQVFADKFED